MEPITNCRACNSEFLTEFLDLGDQFLSDFRKDNSEPPCYPLVAVFCDDCKLVQLAHTTPQKEMYHENYGFKSGINEVIKADLDDVVTHAFQYVNDPKSWLDIACNDGTLLSFVPTNVYRVGVDPVGFLCEQAKPHADRIINDYFDRMHFAPLYSYDMHSNWDKYDVITSISCFYDMPDPSRFVEDVATVLGSKGVWVIQQNYMLHTLELSAVDNFCHEHLEYYTLMSLENLLHRFGLEVNEVKLSMVNGGSIRTVVSHKGTFEVDKSVQAQREVERLHKLDTITPYLDFADSVHKQLTDLYKLVVSLKSEGKSICILAASTRGATIWQTAGLSDNLIDYAVERNPAKVGKYFSAIGVPIISEDEFRELRPDYAIIGPWFFANQIIDREREYLKAGGKLIVPLPEVKIHE